MAPRTPARLRRACWGRHLLAVALVAVLNVAASFTLAGGVSRAADAAAAPMVRLVAQTPVVRPPSGLVDLTFTRTGPFAYHDATVQVTLYARLLTRIGLESAIGAPGPEGPVSTTRAVAARCLAGGTLVRLLVALAPLGARPPPGAQCGAPVPVLRLACTAACDGVYPLRVTVRGGGTVETLVTLVTFAAASHSPLRLVWVLRLAGRDHGLLGATAALGALAAHPRVPATVDVQGVALAHGRAEPGGGAGESVLQAAVAGSVHELVGEAYVPADLGALRASRLPSEVLDQFALTREVLAASGVTTPASRDVTLASGPVTPTAVDAAAFAGFHHVVLPGDDLTVDPSATLSWGAPFHLAGAPGGATALAADTELSELSEASGADPGLVAAQFLGELAFLHFEEPNLPQPRAVVVLTDATSAVPAAFVDAVLDGLSSNPVLDPVTASDAFSSIPVAANGLPATWTLDRRASRAWPRATIHEIRSLRVLTDALASAVVGGATPVPMIEGLLLGAERVLPSATRTDQLRRVHLALIAEQHYFHIYSGPITLTSTGATTIPITILSSAPYSVTGVLRLSSPRITFPKASQTFTLSGAVYSVRVRARALVNGDLPLTVRFLAPDAKLVLAHAMITVRVTGFSVVGLALSVLAVAVLAAWWLRTLRHKRTAR